MEENIRSLLAQECFYFRTSLNWTVESGVTLDKCLLVMVERGKASVFVGENEYTLERNQILFMRPELPLKKLRSTTDFSVSLMAFRLLCFGTVRNVWSLVFYYFCLHK